MGTTVSEEIAEAGTRISGALRVAADGGRVDGVSIRRIRALVDQVERACDTLLRQFVDTGDYLLDGAPNPSERFTTKTHAAKTEASSRLRRHKLLGSLPLFNKALEDAQIGLAHVRTIASVATPARHEYLTRDEQILLNSAKQLTPARFAMAVRRWASLVDDELSDPTSADTIEQRRHVYLNLLPDGMWRLEGILTPGAGEALSTALEAAMPKPTTGNDRTRVQRRHDALADLAHAAMGASTTLIHGERPHITFNIDASTGQATGTKGWVPPSWLRDAILCDATITSVWFNQTGQPFDVGTPQTEIPIRNRRAVIARDQCCRFPGCDRAPQWSDIHHIRYRGSGGRHEIDNLVVLCRFHHHFVHKHDLKLAFATDNATLTVRWPDGTLTHSPPPHQWPRVSEQHEPVNPDTG